MKKTNTKRSTNTTAAANDVEQVEKSPAELQRENDGADHGHRMHSRFELEQIHGKDVLEANERKAREIRNSRNL
jgi:hypothetical protein